MAGAIEADSATVIANVGIDQHVRIFDIDTGAIAKLIPLLIDDRIFYLEGGEMGVIEIFIFTGTGDGNVWLGARYSDQSMLCTPR